jgi:hypothetical protein
MRLQLSRIAAASSARTTPTSPFLAIEVVSSGVVRIRLGNFTVSYFRPGADLFLAGHHILPLANEVVGRRLKTKADGQSLTAIVGEMLSLAHGGTMLVVPDNEDEWNGLESVKYGLEQPSATLRRLLDSVYESVERPMPTEPQEDAEWLRGSLAHFSSIDKLRAECVAIARLSAVDGALIVDTALRVRGFAAKILMSPSLNEVVEVAIDPLGGPGQVPQWRESRRTLTELGGMRHQSAATFVGACKGSLAFVVSQNRKASLMLWDETRNDVIILRDLELLL